MKINQNRYYRPISSLVPGDVAYISHEAIKISLSGTIYLDLHELVYVQQTLFQLFVEDNYHYTIMDYSHHVWRASVVDLEHCVEVQEYVEAYSAN